MSSTLTGQPHYRLAVIGGATHYHQPVPQQTARWQSLYTTLLKLVLRPTAPPLWVGVLVAAGFIVGETLLVLQLKRIAPENAFGALFLLGVLVVSAAWGFGLAVTTSLVSALVYVYFHLEGGDSFAPAVFVFLPLALLANLLAGQARLRAAEAEQRRIEADLSAELARSTLRAGDLRDALDGAGRRLAEVLGLPSAQLDLGVLPGDDRRTAIVLRDDGAPVGTLLVPADLPKAAQQRVHRMIPALEGLLAATRDRWEINAALEASHAEVSALANQQTALRRVATIVARGARPADVFPVAVAELAAGLRVQHVTLVRYENGDQCVVLATLDRRHSAKLQEGERFSLDGASLSALIRHTSGPARIDDYAGVQGPIAERMRALGLRSGVGAPVVVDGEVRGALVVGSDQPHPMPPECEAKVSDFADLVATAIHNAETRAELQASRARIITAADHARRAIERDLHDGAQQRLVALGLDLRAVEAAVPAELADVQQQLRNAVAGLTELHRDLQELSRGIHPAILSRGGLGAAVKSLARRSPVPVTLDFDLEPRADRALPEPVQVAAYYVVAESLTNAAKHAGAEQVAVRLHAADGALRLSISDDGVGGATTSGGSGLIGLSDRVAAVSGRLDISSPPGAGTTLVATIPLTAD
jgi:signal transduction histidine kinase